MRTSRISQETSKVVSVTSSPSIRRSTRSSLSRFASSTATKSELELDLPLSHDIEDALLPPKRKRSISSTPQKPRSKIKPDSATAAENQSSPARRVRKPARQIKDPDTGEIKIEPPADWEEVYALVKEMRLTGAAQNAAVDTMGCERLALPTVSPRDQRYHTLTALMLSSQTKDTTNASAMARLQRELPPHRPDAAAGLNLENILAVEPEKLNELIWAVGFHNNKTRYIKAAAEIIRDEYKGEIPGTAEGLMGLPGVGPKMAYLCLSAAWGKDEGIGVDVHVHRITNLWGWNNDGSGKGTKGPEETRIALQKWLPREKWREINWLLVGFGQKVCLPVGRRCGECEVGLRGLCRSAERSKVAAGRKIRQEKVEIAENGTLQKKEVIKLEVETWEKVVNAAPDAGVNIENQENVPVEKGGVKVEKEDYGVSVPEDLDTANDPKRRKR